MIRISLAYKSYKQWSTKLSIPSLNNSILSIIFFITNGLYTFNSKCPLLFANYIATSLPITYPHNIVNASHYVGLTLPGIIDEPGSFSGNYNSPNPDLGPEPKNLISLAILCNIVANVDNELWNSVNASFVANE